MMVNALREKKLRVILLPSLVASGSWCLGSALRLMGHEVHVLSRYHHRFGFKADEYVVQSNVTKFSLFIGHLRASKYLFSNYDIVHFNYGSTLFDPGFPVRENSAIWLSKSRNAILSIMQKLEIFILRRRRKKIFVHFQGDDAVQGDISLKIFPESIANHVDSDYYSSQSDQKKRDRIAWFDEFASSIFYVSPDMKWFLPSRSQFIPYACPGLLEREPRYPELHPFKLRLSHAPSDRTVKGTSFLVTAVAWLQENGFAIELDLIENSSHDEVLERIAMSDVYVDQLHHGWYGGVAVEAMALGKPVVCFIRQKDLVHIPFSMSEELPIIRTSSKTIRDDLLHLLTSNSHSIHSLGIQSRKFVEKWHNPETVANMILEQYYSNL